MGLVTNNKDPEKLGRVKVKFPWMTNDEESHWARIATMDAGKDRGSWWIPEINDEVLCVFEHGDVDQVGRVAHRQARGGIGQQTDRLLDRRARTHPQIKVALEIRDIARDITRDAGRQPSLLAENPALLGVGVDLEQQRADEQQR